MPNNKNKKGSFRKRSSVKAAKKQSSDMLGDFFGAVLDEPQKQLMKAVTGIHGKPSDVVNAMYKQEYPDVNLNDNKFARAMTDIVVDPLNLLNLVKFGKLGMKGERFLSNSDKLKKGAITGTGLYDNAGEVVEKLAFGSKSFGADDLLTQYFQNQSYKKSQLPNRIENPNQTLADNDIRMASAMADAQSNPLTQGLDIFGNLAMQAGSIVSQSGGEDTPSMKEGLGKVGGFLKQLFANGGTVQRPNAEVEGQEVAQVPNGQVVQFNGPSHEQGGIDVNLPVGTDVYSKRIKHPKDGKAMAKRKADREKKISKLEKLAKLNPSDQLVKQSLARLKKLSAKADEEDLRYQELVAQEGQGGLPKLADGVRNFDNEPEIIDLEGGPVIKNNVPRFAESLLDTSVAGYDFDGYSPENVNTFLTIPAVKDTKKAGINISKAGLPTLGDAMGIYGNLRQAIDPLNNTLQNRAGDTPNINAFEDFGKDGLAALENAKGYIAQERDNALFNLESDRVSIGKRNRNSSRGINSQRALDLATDNQLFHAKRGAHLTAGQQLAGIEVQRAGMENQQDQMVMQGEQAADLANRQDRDAFYTELGRGYQNMGEAISNTGKALNGIKKRAVDENFLNALSDYIDGDITTGKFKVKDGIDVVKDTSNPESVVSPVIDANTYNNFVNPKTGKPFTEKQWINYQKGVNEYTPELKEVNTDYKNFVDPNTKNSAFKNKAQYDKFLASGRDISELAKYKGLDKVTGSFSKSVKDTDKALDIVAQYTMKEGLNNFDLNNKEDVKKLQQKLNLKKVDGDFGNGTLQALIKYMKK